MVSVRLLLLSSLAALAASPSPTRAEGKRPEWRPGWLPGEPVATAPAPLWTRPVKVTNTHGLYIAIDPLTHRPIAPTPEQIRVFREAHAQDALQAPTRPLRIEKLPNGGEILFLNGAFRSYSIARRASNGHFGITETSEPPAPEVK